MKIDRVELGELCNFIRGVTFDAGEVSSSTVDGYVPIMRAGNIGDALDIIDDLVWVPADRVSDEQYLQVGDIAICMSSGSAAVLGKTAQLTKPFIGSVGAFCGIIRPRNIVQANYIAHWLHSPTFMTWRDRQARGVNIQNLRFSEFAEVQIPLPPLPEQQRIAAILDRVDRLRRTRRYAAQLSDSFLQAVFIEMFGDPRTNVMGWDIESVGDNIDSIRYGTGSPPEYQSEGIPFIRATNIKGGTVKPEGMVFISKSDAEKISKCEIRQGNLIIVRSGVNAGDCAIIPENYDRAFAAYDLIVEVPYPRNVYYNQLINSIYGKAIIGPLTRRAGQPHLNAEQIQELRFPLPPLALQEKFARIVQQFDRLRAQQREAERQAEHLFQALLHRAFTEEL